MIKQNSTFNFAFLAGIVIATSLILSSRNIPPVTSPNDTGRYVYFFHQYCAGNTFGDLGNLQRMSYNIFYGLFWPQCAVGDNSWFLFEAAAIFPLGLLIVLPRTGSAVLLAASLLFSVYGIELMTNALRQGLSTTLILVGIHVCIRKRPTWQWLSVGLIAALSHISGLVYLPLLIWLARERPINFRFALSIVTISAGGILLALFLSHTNPLNALIQLSGFFEKIYSKRPKFSFTAFMLFPFFATYIISSTLTRQGPSLHEQKAFRFSATIVLLSMLIYPAITYRVVLMAVPVQIFFLCLRSDRNVLATIAIVFMLTLHVIAMTWLSSSFLIIF